MPPRTDHDADVTFIAPLSRAASGEAPDVSHLLTLLRPGALQRRISVGPTPLTIGRVAACDVVLDGAAVSRAHCRLELSGGEVIVTDLSSTNGTFVDGRRLAAPTALQHGATLHVGGHAMTYERRTLRELEEAAALDRDAQEASAYVQSLLPDPLRSGPVRTEWLFLPCAQLGGAGFGTGWVTPGRFAAFMVGVAGRGTAATMQCVTVMNLLRQCALPGVDFTQPAAVLSGLNATARPDLLGASSSVWYGVFDVASGRVSFASAGHFPALLACPEAAAAQPLATACPAVGTVPGHRFVQAEVDVPAGAALHLFSDGVPELLHEDRDGALARLCGLVAHGARQPGVPEPLRLYQAVRAMRGHAFDEDFVALVVSFPELSPRQ